MTSLADQLVQPAVPYNIQHKVRDSETGTSMAHDENIED